MSNNTLSTILRGRVGCMNNAISRPTDISSYVQVHKTSFLTFHIDNYLAETFEYNIPDIFSYITNKKLLYIILHGTSYKQ